MTISSQIAPHLPYLRRFARALTGGQTGGDAYTVATLQTLIEDPSLLDEDEDVRVTLYRLLLRIWSALRVEELVHEPSLGQARDPSRRNLEALTPQSRIAFLLTAVDGFTEEQVARVLRCSPAEAHAHVAAAREELAQEMATDVLIIEDEPIIAMDLEALVESQGHRVIGVAATHGEALEIVRQKKPGLVLADIQLADGSSGLDAVNDILESFTVPVIFVTAFPEQLLTGDRPEPAFLVTKPFRAEALKVVIGQALFFSDKAAAK